MPSLAVNPVACATDWIIDSLRNNSTLMTYLSNDQERVRPFPHDITTSYPAVGFALINPKDIGVVGGAIIMSDMMFSIVGVDKADTIVTVYQIAAKIHDILDNMFNASDPDRGSLGKVQSCERFEPVYYTDRDKDDAIWQYLGGLYRIRVQ